MGAWAEDTFGNDTACDWIGTFLEDPDCRPSKPQSEPCSIQTTISTATKRATAWQRARSLLAWKENGDCGTHTVKTSTNGWKPTPLPSPMT